MIVDDIAKFLNNSRNGIINESQVMATTLDWVKSLRADIRGDCGKGWNLRGREVGGKMVMQIDRNDENGRSTLLTNIGWRKDNKRNILNAIVEIKDFMYHNGDSLKEAYKKFSNQSEYAPVIKGQLKQHLVEAFLSLLIMGRNVHKYV